MKIWGRINSTNVRKVLWCAEELGITYDRVDAGGAFGLNTEPAYLAMNPNGLVPCLEDDGLVLWESNAIVRYLARTHGRTPFVPAIGTREGEMAFAAADKWLDWTSTTLAAPSGAASSISCAASQRNGFRRKLTRALPLALNC